MLKSDTTNDKTKHKKLITTKKNCKKVNDKILVSNTLEFLKFFEKNKKELIQKKVLKVMNSFQ